MVLITVRKDAPPGQAGITQSREQIVQYIVIIECKLYCLIDIWTLGS